MSCSVSSSQGVLLTSLPSTGGKERVSFSIISSGEKWIYSYQHSVSTFNPDSKCKPWLISINLQLRHHISCKLFPELKYSL